MTPAEALAMYRKQIGEVGEAVSIRRYSGVGQSRTYADTVTTARVMGYQPRDLIGSVEQGDRRIVALVDSLASILPLTTNDRVVVRGSELKIMSIDDSTRRIGGTLIAIDIQARG